MLRFQAAEHTRQDRSEVNLAGHTSLPSICGRQTPRTGFRTASRDATGFGPALRSGIRRISSGTVLAVLCLLSPAAADGVGHINIVIMMVDDMGYGDAGCYGGTAYPTPNIDRLATEGVRFTDFHSSCCVTLQRHSVSGTLATKKNTTRFTRVSIAMSATSAAMSTFTRILTGLVSLTGGIRTD